MANRDRIWKTWIQGWGELGRRDLWTVLLNSESVWQSGSKTVSQSISDSVTFVSRSLAFAVDVSVAAAIATSPLRSWELPTESCELRFACLGGSFKIRARRLQHSQLPFSAARRWSCVPRPIYSRHIINNSFVLVVPCRVSCAVC